jgi:hypothetical protein
LSQDFHLKEYEALRSEVRDIMNNIFSVGRAVLLASAVIFAWFATSAIRIPAAKSACLLLPTHAVTLTLYIPLALSIFSLGYFFDRVRFVEKIGSYIKTKHEELYAENKLGWEHYSSDFRKWFGLAPQYTVALCWMTVIIVDFVAALVLNRYLTHLSPC